MDWAMPPLMALQVAKIPVHGVGLLASKQGIAARESARAAFDTAIQAKNFDEVRKIIVQGAPAKHAAKWQKLADLAIAKGDEFSLDEMFERSHATKFEGHTADAIALLDAVVPLAEQFGQSCWQQRDEACPRGVQSVLPEPQRYVQHAPRDRRAGVVAW